MCWPLNFNLVLEHDRFSRKYGLPYLVHFKPVVFVSDEQYIKFMIAVRLFLVVQLRLHNV